AVLARRVTASDTDKPCQTIAGQFDGDAADPPSAADALRMVDLRPNDQQAELPLATGTARLRETLSTYRLWQRSCNDAPSRRPNGRGRNPGLTAVCGKATPLCG